MSRRKAFETNLSGGTSAPVSRPPATTTTKPPRKLSNALPPSVTPPDPAHAHATVPTETTEENGAEVKSGSEGGEVVIGGGGEVDDQGTCFICAEPITFWSVGVCGHRTCHICAIRLRVFYKRIECTYCKTPLPSLLFSRSPETPFPAIHHVKSSPPERIAAAQANEDKVEKGHKWYEGLILPGKLDIGEFEFGDEKLGVVFEDGDMMEATLLLLRFNCPANDCAFMASNWAELEDHTLGRHGLVICKLCRSQLSRFAHEQVLYPPHLLGWHDPSRLKGKQRAPKLRGDEVELVKSWDAPHPMCEFCHEGFFGPDELFTHMRHAHEECHVCKQMGQKDVYFKNMGQLETHFSQDHYACRQPICLEKKFQVFPSEVDLRAHMIAEHGEHMTARDRAQARTLPMDFTTPHSDNRRQGTGSGVGPSNSGRGFQLSRDAPIQQNLSAAPAMTPAQAAQHRRQVQTDRQEEGRRRRGFETTLTGSERVERHDDGRASGFATPREDVDEATAARHAALLSRVSVLVHASENKLSSFRSAVRQYRNNESGAKDMIDTIYHVLDSDADATFGVLKEIANLFDGEGEGDKQKAVLEAINAFRVEQREQFPALNVPAGHGSDWAGITSGKILNAKRVTQTTGRSGTSRAVWDRVEAAAANQPVSRPAATSGINGRRVPGAVASNPNAFPTLSGGAPSRSATHSTPWSTGGAGSSSKQPSVLTGPVIRSVNYPTPTPTKAKPLNTSAFPSLPSGNGKIMTKEERQALFAKPNARDESIRRIMGNTSAVVPVGNGWGSGGGVVEGMQGLQVDDEGGEGEGGGVSNGGGAGGGKKKGKGKQLLFNISARP